VAFMKPPVRRHRGGFSVHLTADQSELLLRLLDELALMLTDEAPENQARVARLFPPAFTQQSRDGSGEDYSEQDYSEHEAEYQRLMRDELLQSRLASIAAVRECLSQPRHLTEAQLIGFMQAVNSLRLVLGTILQISEDAENPDLEDPELSPEDQDFGLQVAYQFLSWVLEWTVTALSR
jgi:hypothetical protein